MTQELHRQEYENSLAMGESNISGPGFDIELYYHVIAANSSNEGGNLTFTSLDNQLDVLIDAYAPHNISFTLIGTDWTLNASWTGDL